MCAYIKCTYKFQLAFLHALTQKNSDVEFGSENNFFSPTSKKKLFRLIFMPAKKNRKNFNFILEKSGKKKNRSEKIVESRGRNETNAFDKQRNTLVEYTASEE